MARGCTGTPIVLCRPVPSSGLWALRPARTLQVPIETYERDAIIQLIVRSAHPMKHTLHKALRLALAIAPLAAIALVEAAIKRWG